MLNPSNLSLTGALVLAALCALPSAVAQPAGSTTASGSASTAPKPTAKPAAPPAAKPAAKPTDAATPTAPSTASTKPAAKAAATPAKAAVAAGAGAATVVAAAALSSGQMDAAQRVFTGTAACEFGESISLSAADGKPGHFTLKHKAASYTLVPEETTTGAVRLEDKRAGIVWLQIPSKSMLMNSKIGQRVADNCTMAQQKG